jgi:hypothetical protein
MKNLLLNIEYIHICETYSGYIPLIYPYYTHSDTPLRDWSILASQVPAQPVTVYPMTVHTNAYMCTRID